MVTIHSPPKVKGTAVYETLRLNSFAPNIYRLLFSAVCANRLPSGKLPEYCHRKGKHTNFLLEKNLKLDNADVLKFKLTESLGRYFSSTIQIFKKKKGGGGNVQGIFPISLKYV